MVDLLLKKIKELEEELQKAKNNNELVKNEILDLFKNCKVEKHKKDEFKKRLLKSIEKLNIKDNQKFFNNNYLKFNTFLEIAKNINSGYLIIVNANYEEDIKKFILNFLLKKVSPFFTIDNDVIIGFVDEDQMKKVKNINTIPYFNPLKEDFNDIELKKIIFDVEKVDFHTIEKAKKIFNEFSKRPAYKNKHYIEYSLIKDKIVDFEKEKLNKEKEKYAFIYEETYPNLEFKLKRDIKNIPFVLALLERIDKEIDEIKESKGTINVVNRMLNFIDLNIEELREEIKVLRNKLKEN